MIVWQGCGKPQDYLQMYISKWRQKILDEKWRKFYLAHDSSFINITNYRLRNYSRSKRNENIPEAEAVDAPRPRPRPRPLPRAIFFYSNFNLNLNLNSMNRVLTGKKFKKFSLVQSWIWPVLILRNFCFCFWRVLRMLEFYVQRFVINAKMIWLIQKVPA